MPMAWCRRCAGLVWSANSRFWNRANRSNTPAVRRWRRRPGCFYERSVPLWADLLGPLQPRRAVTLHNLGITYAALERLEDAERALVESLEVWEDTVGHEANQALDTRRTLAALRSGTLALD